MSTLSNGPARPLTARSIIASTLLGTHPPQMSAGVLVRSCALFGVRENATRVALTRMVAAGELTADDGRYALAGRLRDRQFRQDRSRRGLDPAPPWDGSWRLAVVAGESRSPTQRADLRRALSQRRFAEWREGLWARPDNLAEAAHTLEGCTMVPGALPPSSKDLAERLFALAEWATQARALVQEVADVQQRLKPGDSATLADSFVLNAAVLRHLQADPLLPPELVPRNWPGRLLRDRYEHFDAAFLAIWRSHLRS